MVCDCRTTCGSVRKSRKLNYAHGIACTLAPKREIMPFTLGILLRGGSLKGGIIVVKSQTGNFFLRSEQSAN